MVEAIVGMVGGVPARWSFEGGGRLGQLAPWEWPQWPATAGRLRGPRAEPGADLLLDARGNGRTLWVGGTDDLARRVQQVAQAAVRRLLAPNAGPWTAFRGFRRVADLLPAPEAVWEMPVWWVYTPPGVHRDCLEGWLQAAVRPPACRRWAAYPPGPAAGPESAPRRPVLHPECTARLAEGLRARVW